MTNHVGDHLQDFDFEKMFTFYTITFDVILFTFCYVYVALCEHGDQWLTASKICEPINNIVFPLNIK